MIRLYVLIFTLLVSPLSAQYVVDQSAVVTVDGESLKMPWAGGINAGQYSTVDLNGDGQQDLVVFDRTSAKINTFLREGSGYKYAPEYASLFPEDIRNWMLLRDFNCDGRNDLFISHPFGMQAFINTEVDGALYWEPYYTLNQATPPDTVYHIKTQGFTSSINLQVNGSDIPSIDDLDGDGDLDILVYRFSGSPTVEFHKNLSMEQTGTCDSLLFDRITQTWGEFEECLCGSFALHGEDCPPVGGGREQHQSGKTLLALDMNADGVKDIVVSEEDCSQMFLLENGGTAEAALMQSATSNFPNASGPASLGAFSAGFYEDIDFDGIKDLVVAPNVASSQNSVVNFESSSWLYKNNGSNSAPNFSLVKKDFLQSDMLDFGENAAPAFADYDNDGDLDMFVGSYARVEQLGFRGAVVLFKNNGSPTQPLFVKETDDYWSLSALNFINIKPRFHDINADGRPDFVFSATQLSNASTNIYYLINESDGSFSFNSQVNFLFNLGNSSFNNNENWELFDVDSDGLLDLLAGRSTGRLEYYKNVGTGEAPSFQLEDESFYGFDFSVFRQSLAPTITDLDADGTLDLMVGDGGGNLEVFYNFLDHLENPLEGEMNVISNSVTNKQESFRIGSRIIPVAANIFSEDKTAVVVGTGQGGLIALRNEGSISAPAVADLNVFPNPVLKNEALTLRSTRSMVAKVITVTGQQVMGFTLPANKDTRLNVSQLREGMYIIVGRTGERIVARRFIVTD